MDAKSNDILEANKLLALSDDKIKNGMIDESQEILFKIIKLYPEYGPAYNHLGWVYANYFNDYTEAEKHYQLALKTAPEYPSTYINYAVLLNFLSNFDAAKDLLNEALNIHGVNQGKVYNELGFLYEMQGRFEEALDAYVSSLNWTILIQDLDPIKNAIHRCRMKIIIMNEENDKIIFGPSSQGT